MAAGMGPTYQVSREPDIPIGSMIIPQDVREVIVVIDTRSNVQRVVVAIAYATALYVTLSTAAAGL